MRVLRVTPAGGQGRLQFGGAERGNVNQAAGLSSLGVEVVTASPNGLLGDELESAGCRHLLLDAVGSSNRPRPASIRRAIAATEPDVVHFQLLAGALIGQAALLRPRRIRKPVLVSFHNSLRDIAREDRRPLGAQRVGLLAMLERGLGLLAGSEYLAVSEHEASTMDGPAFGRAKIWTISNEVGFASEVERLPSQQRQDYWAALGVPHGGPVVGFFGRHEHQKGADLVAEMCRTNVGDARVVTTSSGSVSMPTSIFQLGHQTDLSSMLAQCDAVLMPSRYEAFGRLAVETLANGVPLVYYPTGGLLEVTEGLSQSLLFPMEAMTVGALRDALDAAMKPCSAAESSLRERDRVLLRNRFSIQASVEQWKLLYERMAAT